MFCPVCNREMPMEHKTGWSEPVEVTYTDGRTEMLELQDWSVFRCQGCHSPVVISRWDGDDIEVVYPKPKLSDLTNTAVLPAMVREDLTEAERCYHSKLNNAFGAMARRVVHSVCTDKGASGHDLYTQIEYLVRGGVFSADVAQRAHAIRTLGRNGTHPEWEPVTPSMTHEGMRLLHWFVRTVYAVDVPQVPAWASNSKKRQISPPAQS